MPLNRSGDETYSCGCYEHFPKEAKVTILLQLGKAKPLQSTTSGGRKTIKPVETCSKSTSRKLLPANEPALPIPTQPSLPAPMDRSQSEAIRSSAPKRIRTPSAIKESAAKKSKASSYKGRIVKEQLLESSIGPLDVATRENAPEEVVPVPVSEIQDENEEKLFQYETPNFPFSRAEVEQTRKMNSETPKNAYLSLDVNKMRWVYPMKTDNINKVDFDFAGNEGRPGISSSKLFSTTKRCTLRPALLQNLEECSCHRISLSLTNYQQRHDPQSPRLEAKARSGCQWIALLSGFLRGSPSRTLLLRNAIQYGNRR